MKGEHKELSQAKWMALWGAILLVCWLLRVGIAVRGGQDYWPDEFRYFQGADAARDLLDGGENARAKQVLFGTPEHAFFRWLSLPPGALEAWWGRSPVWVGAYWALFSVAVIGLVGVVARRAGAGRWEAGWAMGLAATATTLACYGRFLLPYDAALALVMAGLALGIRAESVGRMVGAGLAVGLGVLTYNGYWLAGGMVMLLVVLSRWQGGMGLVGRAVSGGVGLVAPGLAWWGTGRMLGYDTWAGLRSFSGSIIQGDFGLGYRVIGEYLWWTEGWWLAPVGVGIMAALVAVGRDRRWEREAWWVVAIAGIVGGLIFFPTWSKNSRFTGDSCVAFRRFFVWRRRRVLGCCGTVGGVVDGGMRWWRPVWLWWRLSTSLRCGGNSFRINCETSCGRRWPDSRRTG